MNNHFALVGAGGHAKVIIEIIEEMGGNIVMINDNNASLPNLLGYSITRQRPSPEMPVVIAIGNNRVRKRIASELDNKFGIVVHPRTSISKRSLIGEGTVVMAGASINSNAVIGKHCIINTNASVDHDCVLGDFVHISPGASLAGNISVGEGTQIGIGSSVIPGIKIGKWVVIGAGAAVTRDVPDYAVVVGVPGNIIKFSEEE